MLQNRIDAVDNKRKRSNWVYGMLFFLFIALLAMREWKWRFVSPFEQHTARTLSGNGSEVPITIRQFSTTPVDTVRTEFSDPRQGITKVSIWKNGGSDTLTFSAKGHYYSNLTPISFSEDHARELFLIPNSEMGLALGLGELIYLDTASRLHVYHIESSNIGDLDSDGVYEIYDQPSRKFQHLDRATGKWNPINLGHSR